MAKGGYRSSVQAQPRCCALLPEARCGCSRRETTAGRHGLPQYARGGFVDGDRVRLRISVGEGARGFVSARDRPDYRSPRGCESETLAEVGAGAALVLAPDPTPASLARASRQRTASILRTARLSRSGRPRRRPQRARGAVVVERCSLASRSAATGGRFSTSHGCSTPRTALRERLGRFEAPGNRPAGGAALRLRRRSAARAARAAPVLPRSG